MQAGTRPAYPLAPTVVAKHTQESRAAYMEVVGDPGASEGCKGRGALFNSVDVRLRQCMPAIEVVDVIERGENARRQELPGPHLAVPSPNRPVWHRLRHPGQRVAKPEGAVLTAHREACATALDRHGRWRVVPNNLIVVPPLPLKCPRAVAVGAGEGPRAHPPAE